MFERFLNRSHELERLDTGDYTDAEYKRWQREMEVIHRIFGESRALENSLLREVSKIPAGPISILDVGAGTGILLREISRKVSGAKLIGVEMDFKSAQLINAGRVYGVQADGTQLPFDDNSFDFAYCTLLLHHLSDENAVGLIREMNRVTTRGIYVIDLNRDAKAYYLYRILGKLLLQSLTLEDGSLSILRSFTADELIGLSEAAGLPNARVTPSKVNRLILSSTKD